MATIRPRRNKKSDVIGHQAIIRRKGYPPQSKVFTRRADAKAWASIIESEIERGEFVDRSEADNTTLAEALTKYENEVTPRKKGHKAEKVRIAYWKRHRMAKTAISKLRASHFQEWRDQELKSGKSPNTVRNGLTLISHLFTQARKEWGLPVRNPIAELWRPKPRRRHRRYRDGEEEKLLDAAPKIHPCLPAAIIVLTETAMRRGEFVKMVRPNLHIPRRVYSTPETKNDQPKHVPLSKTAIDALESLPRYMDGRIWPWRNPDTLTHLFGEARALAGIEDFHLHDLRHEATSRLAKIYSAQELAKIRGDKTLNELMGYYHPTAAELVAKLARA